MDPLDAPAGRDLIARHLQWIPIAVQDVVREEGGFHDDPLPAVVGAAWSHDPETGWADELRVLVEGAEADPDRPDEWPLHGHLGADADDEAAGARLVAALSDAGDPAPADTIALAVAERLQPRHWAEFIAPATGLRLWTRRRAVWHPVGAPLAAPAHPDLGGLGRWVPDATAARSVQSRVAAVADAVRSALRDDAPTCGIALLVGEGLTLGYLFALTTVDRDAHADPASLLADPGSWEERDPAAGGWPEPDDELDAALWDAGAPDPDRAFLELVAAALRTGAWPAGVSVTDDLRVVVGDH